MSADFLREIFTENGIALFGFSEFSDALPLLPCRAAARIPAGAKSVISCAFPYYIKERGQPRNLSRYACVCDYHAVAGAVLEKICTALTSEFSRAFVPFVDNSPLLEVACAVRAGLGVLGDNGLLITKPYGSYVFLGEIVTDLPLPATNFSGECLHCGRCAAACPTACIKSGGNEKSSACLSAITQKKSITESEGALIAEGGSAWGCDICSEVCPLNCSIEETPINAFLDSFHPFLSEEELPLRLENSAFNWRGKAPISRNLQILLKLCSHP